MRKYIDLGEELVSKVWTWNRAIPMELIRNKVYGLDSYYFYEEFELIFSIHQLLFRLDTRRREIILLRFGFKDNKEHTLKEIGKILGVTSARIRWLINDSLRKLRAYLSLESNKYMREVLI